jgi:hypothetical protein
MDDRQYPEIIGIEGIAENGNTSRVWKGECMNCCRIFVSNSIS